MSAQIMPYRYSQAGEVVRLWNRVLGQRFPLRRRLFHQQTSGDPNFRASDAFVALEAGAIVGFILAKVWRGTEGPCEHYRGTGWITALAVDPGHQRMGIGTRLLAQAEGHLRSQGATLSVLGGSFHHFFPGVPTSLPGARAFFQAHGYTFDESVSYDLLRDLGDYETPAPVENLLSKFRDGVEIGPCRECEAQGLLEFVSREFSGRWWWETRRFLELGGDSRELMLLREAGGISGFCHVFTPCSQVIGPCISWAPLLGRRYGGLGPIGIAEGSRKRGLGMALLCRSLEYLKSQGARRTVIDWTTLLGFYGKLGFVPWKSYWHGEKALSFPTSF